MKPSILLIALCLLITLVFSGCPQNVPGGGLGGPNDDDMPINGGCPFGFTPTETGDCNCDAGKVNIADKECFELPPGFYYTDMAGCLLAPGLAVSFSDSIFGYNQTINLGWSMLEFVAVNEDEDRIRKHEGYYSFRHLPDGRDSIWFNLTDLVYTPRFEDWGRLYFLGATLLTNPDVIEGVIVRGRGGRYELLPDPGQEVDRCNVVLRR